METKKQVDPSIAVAEQGAELFHEIFTEPTQSLSWAFRILFGLASTVTGLCQVTIKQLLLPNQVYLLDPVHRFTTFALIASVGAIAGVVISPLAGALSDRTTARLGRRRPWIIFGIVVGTLGLIMMAQSRTIVLLLIGEIIVQIAFDTIMSATTAIIPDQVPQGQRAIASAFIGMSPIVGGLIGLLLVARFADTIHDPAKGYYIVAITSCIFVGLFLLVLREKPLPKGVMAPFKLKTLLEVFWVNPRKYPDFALTWLSRSLMFLGYTILISYILFYLRDVIHYPGADKGVAIFQAISTIILIITAIIGGRMADKLQRLKLFVSAGALIMMLSLILIALVPVWNVMLGAGALLGIGFGIYLSVDIALAVRVLPRAGHQGKDLGLINTAIFIPLIFSPLIGAAVLNNFHNNYAALFLVAAVCFLLAAIAVLPIKSVR
ncbi:MFS transporter [Ktedonosporobacter rubrisoli]|uniref:MFS transporter n=1 Tax=Ktedonosporobacter rubrisoli TaxID=2509675 RepID=A0A4V0Z024_KTERU|nr:MFS transporter [Ktedonosporobacter rubrisoli]QBD81731.1 MFS transporter [Ktedonosporobacter rubrisoli]